MGEMKKGIESPIPMVLFGYSTRHLLKKDKIRFYYALKGRDGKSGIIKRTDAVHLGKTVILAPLAHDQEIQEFLNYWGCPYSRRRITVEEETSHQPDHGTA